MKAKINKALFRRMIIFAGIFVSWISLIHANDDYTSASDFIFDQSTCSLTVKRKAGWWWHHNYTFTVPDIYQNISWAKIYPHDITNKSVNSINVSIDVWNYCRTKWFSTTSTWLNWQRRTRYFQYESQKDAWIDNDYVDFNTPMFYSSVAVSDWTYNFTTVLYHSLNQPIIEYDTNPPSVDVTFTVGWVTSNTLDWTNQDVTVKVACSDVESGCDMRSINWWQVSWNTYIRTFSTNFTEWIYVFDKAWNRAYANSSVWKIDKIKPNIAVTCTWLDWNMSSWSVTCVTDYVSDYMDEFTSPEEIDAKADTKDWRLDDIKPNISNAFQRLINVINASDRTIYRKIDSSEVIKNSTINKKTLSKKREFKKEEVIKYNRW